VGHFPPLFIPRCRIRREDFGVIVLDGQTNTDAFGNGLFDFLFMDRPQRGKRGLVRYEKVIVRAREIIAGDSAIPEQLC
jgi:hypothetical protein